MLEIRPIRSGDAGLLHELLGDPEVAHWLRRAGTSGPFTLEECETQVARKVAHWTAHGIGMSLGLRDGRCVGHGTAQFVLVDGHGELEIGWTVARELWGQGIATELGAHALELARGTGARRIVAFTRVDNLGSRRVMEKLGLAHERDFEHAGYPHVMYVTPD